jgi:WD40 repeat protein
MCKSRLSLRNPKRFWLKVTTLFKAIGVIYIATVFLSACQPMGEPPVKQVEHAQGGAFAAEVSASGNYAVVSSLYHGVALWDLNSQGLKFQWSHNIEAQPLTFDAGESTPIMSNENFIFAADISDNDSHAVLADKHNFSLWDMSSGENLGFWQVRKSKVRINQNNDSSAWVNRNNPASDEPKASQIEIIDPVKCIDVDAAANEQCHIIGSIRAINVSNDGNHLVIGKSNGMVTHITVNSGRRLEFLGHQSNLLDENDEPIQINNAINGLDMSPNGRYVLTGSSDGNAYLWDSKSGQALHQFRHSSRVTFVALDPKARYAFTADSKKQSRIWDLKTGKAISNLDYINRQEIFSSARFSDNGKWLLTGAPTRQLTLWDVKTGKQLQQWLVTPRKGSRPQSAVVYSASFINNETQVISESSAGLSEVWNIDNEQR